MIRDVDREELKGMMDSGESFVLIDVLDKNDFDREHICGSINLPMTGIAREAPNLIGKDETVVVYCTGPACTASSIAAEKLESLGYKDIWKFAGGIEEWKQAGYCLEGSEYEEITAAG
ncbi:MAG: rhodanese-like domain-containing protein [Deltaproteobacteria bacterium]|nr:rhodanese-like domain-containing protein [Deltaproteobacteria bacterium]